MYDNQKSELDPIASLLGIKVDDDDADDNAVVEFFKRYASDRDNKRKSRPSTASNSRPGTGAESKRSGSARPGTGKLGSDSGSRPDTASRPGTAGLSAQPRNSKKPKAPALDPVKRKVAEHVLYRFGELTVPDEVERMSMRELEIKIDQKPKIPRNDCTVNIEM